MRKHRNADGLLVDPDRMTLTLEECEDKDGNFYDLVLPARFEVCERCRGRGTHDHEAFSNGFSMSDDFVDADFLDDYWAGRYDVPCSTCGGARVELVPDEDRCTKAQLDDYYGHLQALGDIRREQEAERRMGA